MASRAAIAATAWTAAVLAGCGGSGEPPAPPARQAPAPDSGVVRWLSPDGDDGAAGTRSAPWRTLEAALERVRPATTLMLRPGAYGKRGTKLELAVDGLTLAGDAAGDRPRLLGAVRVLADDVTLRHLDFNGPTGAVLERTADNPDGEEVQVSIEGDRVEVSDCEVRDNRWHAGIYLSGAEDVRLLGNHVHHNGGFDRPAQANLDHGIYFGSGSGLIANNVIERNLAHGVQLYPRARGVTVAFNTIVANGKSGVIFGEDAADNLVVSNLVLHNRDNSIRSSGLDGDGNVVQSNLLWGNGNGNLGTDVDGLALEDNLEADPLVDDDYRPSKKSPGIDRAEPVPGIARDREGVARPQGPRPDIGAYERR